MSDATGRVGAARLTAGGILLVLALAAAAGGCSLPSEAHGIRERFVLAAGVTRQLAAIVSYRDGYRDTVTAGADWRSSDTAVARVSGGLVEARAPGAARISVSVRGHTLAGDLTVVSAPPAVPAAGPLRVSARNPRYFETPAGVPVYLTGSHTWNNFQDADTLDPPPALDYDGYLAWLHARGHNWFRLWTWEQAEWSAEYPGAYYFEPMPYLRAGPGMALDGRPRFDVTRFNPSYFERLRRRVAEAGAQGVYVSVMLFNGFSVSTKGPARLGNPWRGHPFNAANNINGVNGDLNHDGVGSEVETLASDTIVRLEEAYVEQVIDAVGDLDNVMYEICNESDSASVAWQYHMIRLIHDYEAARGRRHPVGMTAIWPGGDNVDLYAGPADWISPLESWPLSPPPASDGRKVVLLDTDHLCGICGTVAWVWEAFTRGYNPALMDGFGGGAIGTGGLDFRKVRVAWDDVRRSMGYTRAYAQRMDLAAARPMDDVCSSGYCLVAPGSEYLVFQPKGGPFRVDLSAAAGVLEAEWLDPLNGITTIAPPVAGGAVRGFTPPFAGDAVLYLHRPAAARPAPSRRRGR